MKREPRIQWQSARSQCSRPYNCVLWLGLAVIGCCLLPAASHSAPADLTTFQIRPGFQIELTASEPQVLDPVDMAWDENGTLYVLEMAGYPLAPSTNRPFPGKIVALFDMDSDGVYDKRVVYADDFQYAESILPYRGGLLVASTPDLLFLKDTNGDFVADTREVLLSGFRVGNAQHNFCGLTWGLDHWVYMANGGNSGKVHSPDDSEHATSVLGFDARYDPEKKLFEATCASTGGFGLAFDDWGHYFGTHNTEHISAMIFPTRYLDRNPHLAWPETVPSISDHSEGGLARIFPIGVPQTRMNHPEQSGYFSGACGITCYAGGAFPEPFNGSIFVGDVVTNLVHRDVVKPDGAAFVAHRGKGEERMEFLASTDTSFRPVNFKTGPDGALYLLDFHRDVIEHPEWIPDEIEKTLDVRAGDDKGRIYRITPKGGLPRVKPAFDRAKLKEAIGSLESPNRWWRETAQRMLIEWNEKESFAALKKLAKESQSPTARLHALWTLNSLDQLPEELLLASLKDSHPGLRENAVKIAEPRIEKSPKLATAVLAMTTDSDLRVGLQAILVAGDLLDGKNSRDGEVEGAMRAFTKLAATPAVDDRWMRMALLSGLGQRPLPVFRSVVTETTREGLSPTDGRREFLGALAEIIGSRGEKDEIAETVGLFDHGTWKDSLRVPVLDGLADGLGRKGSGRGWIAEPHPEIDRALKPFIESEAPAVLRPSWKLAAALGIPQDDSRKKRLARALEFAKDIKAPLDLRREELALLEFDEFAVREELLFDLLDIRHPAELQRDAISQLARGPNARVAPRLLKIWKSLGPEVRDRAGNILLYRRENHDMLLAALENKDLLIGQMNFDLERRRALLFSMNASTRKRAEKLFSDAGVVTRAEAIEKMKPALSLKGNAGHGHEMFKNLCFRCHRIGDEGNEVGPILTDIFRKSAETLLQDILDPNAAVNTEHIGYTIVTAKGEILNGLLHAQNESSVTLREPSKEAGQTSHDTLLKRDEIKEMYAQGLSLMPEELEKDMRPQDMADLIAFLQQPR